MFWRERAARAQASRDREWRRLARAISQPGGVPSEYDHDRLDAYIERLRSEGIPAEREVVCERAARGRDPRADRGRRAA